MAVILQQMCYLRTVMSMINGCCGPLIMTRSQKIQYLNCDLGQIFGPSFGPYFGSNFDPYFGPNCQRSIAVVDL